MLEMIMAFAIWFLPFLVIMYIMNKKSKAVLKHMGLEVKKAECYKNLKEIDYKYKALLVNGELQKYKYISNYLGTVEKVLDEVGMELNFDKLFSRIADADEELDKRKNNDRKFKSFKKELDCADEEIQKLVFDYVDNIEKCVDFKYPHFYFFLFFIFMPRILRSVIKISLDNISIKSKVVLNDIYQNTPQWVNQFKRFSEYEDTITIKGFSCKVKTIRTCESYQSSCN